jgi:hypothetical protein
MEETKLRKVLPYLGASLSALAMAMSTPALAQDQFKDLDPKHWAYEAVTELQQKGILLGYPDGYFRGKRTLTRYEFAIALKRALDKIQATPGAQGPAGPAGAQGEPGPAGPPGMTPEEVANLRRLTDEFRNELTSLGANIREINNRLDAMAKDIADIKNRLDHMIHWGGYLFVGTRGTQSRTAFVDYSGAVVQNNRVGSGFNTGPRGGSNSLFTNADVVHDLHLLATANLAGGAKATVDLQADNYESYRGKNFSSVAEANGSLNPGSNTPYYTESIMPYQAQLDIPVGGPKSDTILTIGRYKQELTALTYYRPTLDSYFDDALLNDGNFVQDGARVKTRFGSLGVNLWAANFATVTDNQGNPINQPLVGQSVINNVGHSLSGKPFGINSLQGSALGNQTAGIELSIPLAKIGVLSGGLFNVSTNEDTKFNPTAVPFNDVVVYNANIRFNPFGRFLVYGEAAKSVTQIGLSQSDGQSNEDNNAYLFNVGYASGPVDFKAGYNYIDPRFAAPGYWMKLGNWENPTNVKGPFVKLGYKLNDAIQLRLGGDYLQGARNRYSGNDFGTSDNIERVNAGLSYKIGKALTLTGDYEGVFYDLSSASNQSNYSNGNFLGGPRTTPVEQYITVGAGYSLTRNAVLKVSYQMINFQNVGNGFGAGTGYGLTSSGFPIGDDQFPGRGLTGGNSYNASVLTTQISVHF